MSSKDKNSSVFLGTIAGAVSLILAGCGGGGGLTYPARTS